MNSAIRFSSSRTQSENSSIGVASAAAAAELLPSVSSITRRHDEDRDDSPSVEESASAMPMPTSLMGSVFSQRAFGGGDPPSATVDGREISGPTRISSRLGTNKGNGTELCSQHDQGTPLTKGVASMSGSGVPGEPEARSQSPKDRPGHRQRRSVGPAASNGKGLTTPRHSHPHSHVTDLPWIPPPPIYGAPLPDCRNMNRFYAHYYDPTAAPLRSPFCYPGDVPPQSGEHHGDVSGAGWPVPSDLPLPSMFPMPPHVLPQPSRSTMSTSEAATRATVAPQHGWPTLSPFFFPPPPPPPWWFYEPPLPLRSASSSSSLTSSSRGSSAASTSSSSSPSSSLPVRSVTRPSRQRMSSAERPQSAHANAGRANPSRPSVVLSTASVATPFAVKSGHGTCGYHAKNRLSVASSDSGSIGPRAAKAVKVAQHPAGIFSAPLATKTIASANPSKRSLCPRQGVERRACALSNNEKLRTHPAVNEKSAQVAPRRADVMRRMQPGEAKEYDEEVPQGGRGEDSGPARLHNVLSAAEAYLEKMEHLYRRMRTRYEEVIGSPEKAKRYAAGIPEDEGVGAKQQPPTATAATTRVTRKPQERVLLHAQRRAPSPQQHLQPAAPRPHTKRLVSDASSDEPPLSITPSPALSSSLLRSSTTSATSLRHELQLLESQWKRLEELKKYGCDGAATTVAVPRVAASKQDNFTYESFLQLIQDRKQLLTSAV
ncbi:hypothetical protein JKF63_05133 [Porcisia hertigi]|uniref:Uncharacterized protein n=1 Tax=Porcisia hertigi TaxID=2761500 RepID=A0A836HU11_9TRYP|nr:hypothetical protein JKF63_05133 [Porcisia hertigi]